MDYHSYGSPLVGMTFPATLDCTHCLWHHKIWRLDWATRGRRVGARLTTSSCFGHRPIQCCGLRGRTLGRWRCGRATTLWPQKGQVLKLTEEEARARQPGFVVATLGVLRKDSPNGGAARVDGVNKWTRFRDQERAPIAADLTWAMYDKSLWCARTLSFAAVGSMAHRRRCRVCQQSCDVRQGASVLLLIARCLCHWVGHSAKTWHMLVADDYHIKAR